MAPHPPALWGNLTLMAFAPFTINILQVEGKVDSKITFLDSEDVRGVWL